MSSLRPAKKQKNPVTIGHLLVPETLAFAGVPVQKWYLRGSKENCIKKHFAVKSFQLYYEKIPSFVLAGCISNFLNGGWSILDF